MLQSTRSQIFQIIGDGHDRVLQALTIGTFLIVVEKGWKGKGALLFGLGVQRKLDLVGYCQSKGGLLLIVLLQECRFVEEFARESQIRRSGATGRVIEQ